MNSPGSRLETGHESEDWKARAGCQPLSVILFYRNFALMFRAGLSMVQILETLTHQTEDPAFAEVVWTMASEIRQGKSLSRAMSGFPRIFPRSVLAMVRTGEESGALHQSLELAGEWSQRCFELSQKVKAALTYPCFVLAVSIVGSVLLCATLLPDLLESIVGMGGSLHWTTRVLSTVAWLVGDSGFWVLLISLLGLGFLKGRDLVQTERGRLALATAARRLPGLGPLLQSAALMRFLTTSRTMIAAGGSLQAALSLAATSSGDVFLEKDLSRLMNGIRTGTLVSECMTARPDLYPAVMVSMIGVGEESGQLAKLLGHVACLYEHDTEHRIETLSTLVEPLLLMMVAGAVIFCLIGLLTPLYSLLSAL